MTSAATDPLGLIRDQYHRKVHAMALRLAANEDDVEDLVQQTFIRAWESMGMFRGESDSGSWL